MKVEWHSALLSEVVNATDYVANGSFESLRNNVTYRREPDFAILVRLADHNAGWSDEFVYVDKASYDFLRKTALEPGDVLIANVGANAGTVFRVPNLGTPMTLGPNAILCRPRTEVNLSRDFLYYYLTSNVGQNYLRSILSGSAQPKFNKTDLRSLPVPIPPLEQQLAIAAILGALDDKIDLNRRMNETLEELARTIFKSWFVDFDPVKAKAEGRQPVGMDAETAALFPSRFVESEMGMIPEGWECVALSEVADVSWGDTSVTKASYTNTGFIAFSAAGPDGHLPYAMFDRTGVIVSAIGANCGATWLVRGKWGCIKNTIRLWATKETVTTEYLFHETLGPAKWPRRGSAQPFIAQSDARAMQVRVPAPGLCTKFTGIVNPLYLRMDQNAEESRVLVELRDLLLPKLISGELRVPDAEKLAEAAL